MARKRAVAWNCGAPDCRVCNQTPKYKQTFHPTLSGFIRGLKSMRPAIGFDWYWKLGPFIHWTDPQESKSEGEMFHFEKAGIGFGPLWVGLRDSD